MTGAQGNLRERTRRAVQREITEAAISLFVERGYDATTIDDIAAAVGMSSRSVFRYFATKEEIVIGKLELGADDMLAILSARPVGEPVWVSLRHVFEVTGDTGEPSAAQPVQRVILETPALLAVFLEKLQGMQSGVVEVLRERAAATGTPYAPEDPTPRALTAAAFGCVVAAQYAWLAATDDGSFADYVGRAMAAITPRGSAEADLAV